MAGASQSNVIFADINGDNRTDYLVKGTTGAITAWLNIGTAGSDKFKLVPAGKIADGQGNGDVVLADLDGDFRDDYLMWDKDGGLSGFLNIRSQSEGQPLWITQGGDKSIAVGTGRNSSLVRLADIDGDGKAVSPPQPSEFPRTCGPPLPGSVIIPCTRWRRHLSRTVRCTVRTCVATVKI